MSGDVLTRVVNTIAKTTRYPNELLTPEADLENDLGIDSVKRLEIVVALGREFGYPLDQEERDPTVRTIRDVALWVEAFIRADQAEVEVEAEDNSPAAAEPTLRTSPDRPASSVVHNAQREAIPRPHLAGVPSRNGQTAEHLPRETSRPLFGKVAVVTGSGRGVGRTIARVLASRGATVVVNSFHSRESGDQTAGEINDEGGSAIHVWGSVANPTHVDQLFDQIEARFGQLDILVCNASDGRIGSFMELKQQDWDRAFRTNVVGHHQCAVRAAPLMRSGGGGSIVTMSAVGANGYIDGLGSQGVVKAAVESLTRYLACELGPHGIRVNCVVGGPIYGDLLSRFPEARSVQAHWESITPDGQLCSPLDLANAIAFLVGDEARGINGSIWNVDHGFSATADGRALRFGAEKPLSAAAL